MFHYLMNLPKPMKGLLLTATGGILLAYVFGIFAKHLETIIIIAGVLMVIYGLILMDGHNKLLGILNGNKKQPPRDDMGPY